jgi:hypothetical protein
VDHVANVVAECTDAPANIEVLYRDDREVIRSGESLAEKTTGQGLSGFRAIKIEGEAKEREPNLHVRVAFVRRPTEVLVGEGDPRRAQVRAGVVLEVTSTDPRRGDKVAATKQAIARAIERGRPRFVTRQSFHGRARVWSLQHKDGEPGSASRLLERRIVGWPKRSGFPVLFIALALAVYVGAVALAVWKPIPLLYEGKVLNWDKASVRRIVIGFGFVVAAAAYVAQRWLFPSVEVATLTNARRGVRAIGSSISISVVAGLLLKIPGFGDLFTPEK